MKYSFVFLVLLLLVVLSGCLGSSYPEPAHITETNQSEPESIEYVQTPPVDLGELYDYERLRRHSTFKPPIWVFRYNDGVYSIHEITADEFYDVVEEHLRTERADEYRPYWWFRDFSIGRGTEGVFRGAGNGRDDHENPIFVINTSGDEIDVFMFTPNEDVDVFASTRTLANGYLLALRGRWVDAEMFIYSPTDMSRVYLDFDRREVLYDPTRFGDIYQYSLFNAAYCTETERYIAVYYHTKFEEGYQVTFWVYDTPASYLGIAVFEDDGTQVKRFRLEGLTFTHPRYRIPIVAWLSDLSIRVGEEPGIVYLAGYSIVSNDPWPEGPERAFLYRREFIVDIYSESYEIRDTDLWEEVESPPEPIIIPFDVWYSSDGTFITALGDPTRILAEFPAGVMPQAYSRNSDGSVHMIFALRTLRS